MGEEAQMAMRMPQHVSPPIRAFFWNPSGVALPRGGMRMYLKDELPVSLNEAVATIIAEASRITTGCS
jgi:hypothetical protein